MSNQTMSTSPTKSDPSPDQQPVQQEAPSDFAGKADKQSQSLGTEFIEFLTQNKKWWLLPIILVLLVFGLLFVISPAVAPFIYTLF